LTKAATLAVAVAGASGRMGRMLIEAVVRADDCRLSAALDVPGSSALGQDAAGFLGADSGIRVTSELRQGIAGAQVLIVETSGLVEPAVLLEQYALLPKALRGRLELRGLLCVVDALHGLFDAAPHLPQRVAVQERRDAAARDVDAGARASGQRCSI